LRREPIPRQSLKAKRCADTEIIEIIPLRNSRNYRPNFMQWRLQLRHLIRASGFECPRTYHALRLSTPPFIRFEHSASSRMTIPRARRRRDNAIELRRISDFSLLYHVASRIFTACRYPPQIAKEQLRRYSAITAGRLTSAASIFVDVQCRSFT